MKKNNYIRFIINDNGKQVTYISYPKVEQMVKSVLLKTYPGDTIVEVRDYNTGYLYEEIKLCDLFNEK